MLLVTQSGHAGFSSDADRCVSAGGKATKADIKIFGQLDQGPTGSDLENNIKGLFQARSPFDEHEFHSLRSRR